MTILSNLPSVFVPLVGLVFPAIAMASLFIHVQKNKIFQIRAVGTNYIYSFFRSIRNSMNYSPRFPSEQYQLMSVTSGNQKRKLQFIWVIVILPIPIKYNWIQYGLAIRTYMDRTQNRVSKNKSFLLGLYPFFRFIRVLIGWNFQLSGQKLDTFISVSANTFFSTRDRDVVLWNRGSIYQLLFVVYNFVECGQWL